MPKYTDSSVRGYLREYFISLDELAERTGLPSAGILELIDCRCIPAASYRITETETVSSDVFGDTVLVENITAQYFPPSSVSWIKRAKKFPDSMPLEDIARDLKAAFRSEYKRAIVDLARESGLNPNNILNDDGSVNQTALEQYFEDTWQEWCKGTYGVCVAQVDTVERIAMKQIAVQRLEHLTDGGAKEAFSAEDVAQVRKAVAKFNSIAMPFAPHDVARSSRQRLVNQVLPRLKNLDSRLPAA